MFKEVDPKIDFPSLEKKWLNAWEEKGIRQKYLHKNNNSEKLFSFIDGPITANNPMGVHHAWGRTYKDIYQRFKNMNGYAQRFQNGFDCQGLWVEVEVEKALGFKNKKDIEKYGLENFTNSCKERVNTFAKQQTQQSIRLGYFMDWDNSYYTMSETNNLYIWRFLKICNEKGLIYKGKSAATWCPRCGTGLSKHEQADSYQDITDTAVYIKFKLKNKNNEYFLVWTTTPWTISANVYLAINSAHKYVKAKDNDNYYYLAEESAKRLELNDYTLVQSIDLLNLEYEAIYDIPAQKGICHKVVEWELVSPEEGTGIVHIAPGCGEEDFELGKRLNAPIISPLDESGNFTEGYKELSGLYANEVSEKVIEYLKTSNSLFKIEPCLHSYPHCWRCKTKCLFRLVENWFINCQAIKDDLKKLARQPNWIPDFVGKRMEDWLENMGDWMISRKRFYGLALPFYDCFKCGLLTVVGSKEELKVLAVNKDIIDKLPSLHRPWIDEVIIKCPNCNEEITRIKDVGDCWLDAGVVPFSTLKYFEDKDYWLKWYPADLIGEMVEQVRLWYYSMLVYGCIFENKVPYKAVFNYVEVRDENGERMSKTKKNGIPYDEAVEKMGADVMRWMYATQNPVQNMNFGYKIADETRRRFHLILWNIYNFFVSYANLDRYEDMELRRDEETKNVLDKWIVSKLNNLIKSVSKYLNEYNAYEASKNIEDFVNEFSTWYIRRSRNRVGLFADKNQDKLDCYSTIYYILVNISKILAPFTPFLSEEIFTNLTNKESVHLCDWPEADESKIDETLENQMILIKKVCEIAHSLRKQAQIKVRQPLSDLFYSIPSIKNSYDPLPFINIIKEELNVKTVIWGKSPHQPINGGKWLNSEEADGVYVSIKTDLDELLVKEGEAREIIRQIQDERKKIGCTMNDIVEVKIPNWPVEFEGEIIKKTQSNKLLKSAQFEVKKINVSTQKN